MFTAITIGNFDGLHRGHKLLLETLQVEAKKRGFGAGVVSFRPHPAKVLFGQEVKLINTYAEKQELLKNLGIKIYSEHEFDKEFSEITATDFIKNIIFEQMQARLLLIGEGFKFGHNGEGDAAFAKKIGKKLGLEVIIFPHTDDDGIKISSNLIRQYILDGNIKKANQLLGHNFFARGFMRRNVLSLPAYKILPKKGTYPVKILLEGKSYDGFAKSNTTSLKLEVQGYSGNLNEKLAVVEFVQEATQ